MARNPVSDPHAISERTHPLDAVSLLLLSLANISSLVPGCPRYDSHHLRQQR